MAKTWFGVLRWWHSALVAIVVVGLAACQSDGVVRYIEVPLGIPADKALLSVQFSSVSASAPSVAAHRALHTCNFEPTHVVTYLSYLDRNTILTDALDVPAAGLDGVSETAIFAPPGEARVYVLTLHYSEAPGQQPTAVVLSGARLDGTVTLPAGVAVDVTVDLAALQPFRLAWVSPLDADDPWFGGPQPYGFGDSGDGSGSDEGIWIEGTVPWDLVDGFGSTLDPRAPEIGYTNSVLANDPSYLFEAPARIETNVFSFGSVLRSRLGGEHGPLIDPDRGTDAGEHATRVGAIYVNGASVSFPGVYFHPREHACRDEFTFVVNLPER